MPISIHYPAKGASVKLKFLAYGLADSTFGGKPVSGIIGTLTSKDGRQIVYGATVLFRHRRHKVKGKVCWAILFNVSMEHAGEYKLDVTSICADGKPAETRMHTDIHVGAGVAAKLIGSTHPENRDELSADEKQYYLAWGDISPPTVFAVSATMTNGAIVVPADYIDTSPDDQLWWATFPPLAAGTYTFTVTDSVPSSDTKINILVRP